MSFPMSKDVLKLDFSGRLVHDVRNRYTNVTSVAKVLYLRNIVSIEDLADETG